MPPNHVSSLRSASVACDLIPYPLLLKEKGDDCDAAPAGPSLSFRRGIAGEVAGHECPWHASCGFAESPAGSPESIRKIFKGGIHVRDSTAASSSPQGTGSFARSTPGADAGSDEP